MILPVPPELQSRFLDVQNWNRRLQKQLGIVPMTIQQKYENIKNTKRLRTVKNNKNVNISL